MPQPDGTSTVQDVISYVTPQFGDEAAVQINNADIARWTNMAVLEIVSKSTLVLQAKSTMSSVVGVSEYEYPQDLIAVYSVMYGNAILTGLGYENYVEYVGDSVAEQGQPRFWAHWANNFYIWPVPSSVKTITVRYSKYPMQVSAPADVIEIPSRYFPRICEYVLSKAQELDEDFAASQASRTMFEQKMSEMDNAPDSMYGQNHVVDDADAWSF